MPRFFASNPIIAQEEIVISGQEARHMQRVLRLRVGDEVDIFDGTGREYRSEIVRQDRLAVTLRIREARKPGRESPLTVIMGQSLIRGQKMDFVIQKATEMGVFEVIPFVSSRSVASLDEGKMERRVDRWKRIAVESSKQSGRVIPLRVEGVLGFDEALERASPGAHRIILWERATRNLKSLFQERNPIDDASRSVYFLVGPEGGFSEDEVRLAEKARFIPIGLRSRILRVETAGLSFASILQYEWGDLG
jgi:16S rRNA (uracil1498-N3)-methyltransferase